MCGTIVATYTVVSFYLTNLILNVKAVLSGVLEVFFFRCVSALKHRRAQDKVGQDHRGSTISQGYTFTTTN